MHRLKRPSATEGDRIWIDLDNTPHVPLFIPIKRELERRGYSVALTARDAFQVCELADKNGLRYVKIGHHYGKNPLRKIQGLLLRATQMMPFCRRWRPRLAVSHGSRSQILCCSLLRIPSILLLDYEYTRSLPFARPRWAIMPEALTGNSPYENFRAGKRASERIRYYRGIKEDVYVPEFKPDPSLREELGIGPDEVVVLVRPPASEAHYYTSESGKLFDALMARVSRTPVLRAVLLPRNRRQEEELRANHPEWFAENKTIIPPRVVNGLDMIWSADVVVSGGGTMNREAAALGVPVYSIFHGKIGAVDHRLEQEGRLTIISSVEEVRDKILFRRREKSASSNKAVRPALEDIINQIDAIARIEGLTPRP